MPSLGVPSYVKMEDIETFHPSAKETLNLYEYLEYLETQGVHKLGAVKIIPPHGLIKSPSDYKSLKVSSQAQKFILADISNNAFSLECKNMSISTVEEFKHFMSTTLAHTSQAPDASEELFWEELGREELPTSFRGRVQDSLLSGSEECVDLSSFKTFLSDKITSEFLPTMSIGVWKSTSGWHLEDMDLYVLYYNHEGHPRTIYCIPPEFAYKLEQVARKLFPDKSQLCFNFMRHKDTLIHPNLLLQNGIPVKKVVLEQGSFVCLFPHSYHMSFDIGFNVVEEMNFASRRWLEYGKRFRKCLCTNPAGEIIFDVSKLVESYQPKLLKAWYESTDFGLHPEDPVFIKRYYNDIELRLRLSFINLEEYKELVKSLMLKREVALWFKTKFPNLDYTDDYELSGQEVQPFSTPPSRSSDKENLKKVKKKKKSKAQVFGSLSQHNREYTPPSKDSEKTPGKFAVGAKGDRRKELKGKKLLFQCPSKKKHKLRGCKKCTGCTMKDCGVCIYCLDKPKNGGKQVLKQKCKERVCINPVRATCPMCRFRDREDQR